MIVCMKYQDPFWHDTIALAKACSFQGAGAFLAACMEDNDFNEDDRVFAYLENGTPIGFCTLTKENLDNDYPYTTWLDFIFVLEEYRGKGFAKALVETVCRYAKAQGYSTLHLLTVSHVEMYQKMGFTFIENIVLQGNDTASILCRKINL